ncbi:MAG TPA: MFS transporter [Armatimonadota bacterium]|jgi:predicted MFS family arabinose efflux permease
MSDPSAPYFHLSEKTRRRLRHAPPGMLLFFLAIALMSVSQGIVDSVYNNYLSDTFQISATTRGQLEFPRELPGLLTAVMTGAFFFIRETGLGGLAAGAVALGLAGLALWSRRWWPMVASTLVWSVGAHLIMPVRDSVALGFAREGQAGRRLGQVGLASTFATIGGFVVVYIGTRLLNSDYAAIFAVGGVVSALAVIAWLRMRTVGGQEDRPRLVIKRRYRLFYLLSLLFGARKQVFITFAPWVLVRVFKQKAYVFAQLSTVGALLGLVFQPLLGHLIDRWGERVILVGEAVMMAVVALVYGFAEHFIGQRLGRPGLALGLVMACFVLDQVLFAVGMARSTYLAKILETPEDLTPSLSLAVSINHIVSMSLPTLGGYVWDKYGYPWVFIGAAVVALVNITVASRIRTPQVPAV